MADEFTRQSIIDEEHLKLLSLGYMISAATTAFFSMFGVMYVGIGVLISVVGSQQQANGSKGQPPPAFLGWLFAGIGLAIFLFMIGLAAAKLQTAMWLKRRQSRTLCMVVAGISCLAIPYGTVLGVLTFMVLGRNSVIRLFDATAQTESVT